MKFIDDIKEKIGRMFLNYKLKTFSRKKGTYNLDNAKTIGVIFNATDQKTYEIARSFIKYIMAGKIKVEAIGFINSTQVLDFYSYQTGVNFFSKKNLNWYKKPVGTFVDEFIEKEFDMLIDLTIESEYPLRYISTLSKAKFKVGRLVHGEEHLDFMIDTTRNNTSIFLVEQLNYYLSLINSRQ